VPCKQLVEELEVPDLLVVHVAHERAQVGVRPDHGRGLGCVDEGCGELARLVDAQLGMVSGEDRWRDGGLTARSRKSRWAWVRGLEGGAEEAAAGRGRGVREGEGEEGQAGSLGEVDAAAAVEFLGDV